MKNKAAGRNRTSGHVGPKLMGFGEPQQADFLRFSGDGKSQKIACVLTHALLAI